VLGGGGGAVDRSFHVWEALAAGVKACQVGPLWSCMRTCGNGLFVLAFSGGEVFLLLGDGAAKMVGAAWIDFIKLAGDLLGFIDAATDYAGGLAIETTEVGKGVRVAWIEADGLFEFGTGALGERERVQE
jgi:hypothetical protein